MSFGAPIVALLRFYGGASGRMMRRRACRLIGGVRFRNLSYGSWLSSDGRLALVLMAAGTDDHQWELYVTQRGAGWVAEVPVQPNDSGFLCSICLLGRLTFAHPDFAVAVMEWRLANPSPEGSS